jgi:large repetitive protein
VWSPAETLNDAFIQRPTASPLETTTYTVLVTDSNNCQNTDEVVITVLEDYTLLVTNVITPNGDGANDQFEIFNIETYPQAELLIFDRWGTEVYQSKPYNNDWRGTYKGKDLPDGTYYYVIRFDGSDKLYKGSVSILR